MRTIDADALVWKIMALCRSYQKTHLVHAEMLEHFTNSVLAYIDHAEEHKTEVKVIQYDSNLSAEPKWIPCSERLPRTGDDILVTFSDGEVDIIISARPKAWVQYEEANNLIFPVAWMPLPKPYREEMEDYDYELATEQMEHYAMYEPTYNPEDGSM